VPRRAPRPPDPMIEQTAGGPSLVVCSTCRHSEAAREDETGVRGGARLLGELRTAAAGDPRLAELAIEAMPCLFACTSHCTVHLRAPGKVGYVLGRFEPTVEAAQAILDYAAHYLESEAGSVPYRLWPQGVKGHFLVRVPPAGGIVTA